MAIQVRARCPRCQTTFSAEVGADGFFLCPGCGARLKHKRPPPSAPTNPEVTARIRSAVATHTAAGASRSADAGASATTPSGPKLSRPAEPEGASLEQLLLRVHETQLQILEILRTRLPAAGAAPHEPGASEGAARSGDDVTVLPPAPTRARRRKNVLLVDDDAQSRQAAVAALEEAQIPVSAVDSGREALASVAAGKPDVLALEGELGGDVTGRDLVDRIKATMEWVDIPIVLYTRAPLQSQEEARTTYSADAYVLKGPSGPQALVSQVIAAFRRG